MKRKGFTLIELLAVIIILGVLMLIAIPSVTSYINNSRKSTYVSTIQELIKGTIIKVNNGELDMFDTDTTYYIESSLIDLESGELKSPYGVIDKSYVVVTYDGNEYNYFFTGRDVTGVGVKDIIASDVLSEANIKTNISADEIAPNVGIGSRSKIVVIDKFGNKTDGTLAFSIAANGGERINTYVNNGAICKRATTLHGDHCDYSWGCNYAIWNVVDYRDFEYGTLGRQGAEPNDGDAFDCDVNGDGIYDAATERFYYLKSKNRNGQEVATLIYYNNVTKDENDLANLSSDSILDDSMPVSRLSYGYGYGYGTETLPNYAEILQDYTTVFPFNTSVNYGEGPTLAVRVLPSSSRWKNPKLLTHGYRSVETLDGRSYFYNYSGTTAGTGRNYYLDEIYYGNKVARFLSVDDIPSRCASSDNRFNRLDNRFNITKLCTYFLENTSFASDDDYEYWIEDRGWSGELLTLNQNHEVGKGKANDAVEGVRPVIEVLKSNIDY